MTGNVFETPSIISKMSVGILHNSLVAARLVSRDLESDFVGAIGNTINVRTPATLTAQAYVRASGITVQDIEEGAVPVALDKFYDVSVAVTAEQLTYAVADFGQQVLAPALVPLAEQIESDVCALYINQTNYPSGSAIDFASDPIAALITADAALNAAKVPRTGRYAILGATMGAELLAELAKTSAVGAIGAVGGDALSLARVNAKIAGFDVYINPYVSATHGWAGAPEAHVLAVRPLAKPQGAVVAESATFDGVTVRVVMGYDMSAKKDVVSLDVLYGVKTILPTRGVGLKT